MVIPLNKGVCGFCATKRESIVVKDVHEFKGHIACDSRSQSEICIPIMIHNEFYGLLDIDSPITNRFDDNDRKNLEKLVVILQKEIEKIIWHYFTLLV